MVGPTNEFDFHIIRYERELRGWSQNQVFDLAESLGLSRNWQQWTGPDADKLIDHLRSQPLSQSQETKRWLDRLRVWRTERGLSQEAVLQIAANAGIQSDPRQWTSETVLKLLNELAKIPVEVPQ